MSGAGVPLPRCDATHGCITCSDEGVPMRVEAIPADTGLAVCADAAGQRSDVLTGLVEPVVVGDMLLVHAGTALLRLPTAGAVRDANDGNAEGRP